MIRSDVCLVWWVTLDAYQDSHRTLLTRAEADRADRLRQEADRMRQVLAAALLRVATSEVTGTSPTAVSVDRTCPSCGQAHGRPSLPGTDLNASVSHSSDRVAVALTAAGPVGVDVERIADVDVARMSRIVLHPAEAAGDRNDFFVYWTRKEAVVKATGDGLAASLTGVHVTEPDQPAALLAYPDRPECRRCRRGS